MVNVQTPLVGLEYTPETGVYIAKLEASLAEACIRDARFRALLELVTGEQWDDVELDVDNAGPQLMRIAEDTLVLRTGMDRAKARTLVAKRWDYFNKSRSLEEVVVPQAVPVEQAATPENAADTIPVYNAKEAFEQWKSRRVQRGVVTNEE